ncbi:hypothetical protein CKA38_09955 [Ereboglobus luteus]|uniref:N-sulphoglucosamine sulphohydrolase C-terminal domain-containing protein n=1 Tax=Ereboglobus luteus TaxID=1796921 RepID=A0A2U8E714_9BACT|nr:hypothetical protein CKA38_09955 [Ereboglobus luteus]
MGSFPQVHYPRRSVRDAQYKLILNINHAKENPHYALYLKGAGHFSTGTKEEEINASSDTIKQAYNTWRFPPEYELYDLNNDPDEWNNLAGNPEYKETLERLKNELYKWRKETKDMILDPKKLQMLNKEMESAFKNMKTRDYRKDKSFKFEYLQYLAPVE